MTLELIIVSAKSAKCLDTPNSLHIIYCKHYVTVHILFMHYKTFYCVLMYCKLKKN